MGTDKSLSGPEPLFQMKRDFQIEFLKSVGLLRSHTLLDFGCSTLRGGIPLISYLGRGMYTGFDIRPKVVEEALKELYRHNLEFKESIITSVLPENSVFDYVWAFSVLIHMDNTILDNTLKYVSKSLSEDGVFYANVNIGNQPEKSWSGFPVVFRSLEFYEGMCKKHRLTCESLGTLKSLGHHSGNELGDNQIMLKISLKLAGIRDTF